MPNAAPFFCQISLIFALLTRWLALWGAGAKPPVRFVRMLTNAEAKLADAIRATLREDGVAFPDLDDPAFLVWFKQTYPCSDTQDMPSPRPCRAQRSLRLDRRLSAGIITTGINNTGWKPAVQQARAPP